eukprot:13910352-Alexandrium_andersonii.AAC.1
MPKRRTAVATPAVPPVVRGRGPRLYKRPSSAEPYAKAPDYNLGSGVKKSDLGLADTAGLETIYDRRGPTGRMKSTQGQEVKYLRVAG